MTIFVGVYRQREPKIGSFTLYCCIYGVLCIYTSLVFSVLMILNS